MRWKAALAGFAVVLAAATSCAQKAPDAGAPPGSAPPSSSASLTPGPPSGSPKPPDGSTPVPATQVDASALPADFPRQVFVGADGRALYVRAEEGGCGHAVAQVREQSARQVVVNLTETKPNLTGQMCTKDLRYPVVPVALAAPLGSRTVVLLNEKPR